jgi:hypothetical protein
MCRVFFSMYDLGMMPSIARSLAITSSMAARSLVAWVEREFVVASPFSHSINFQTNLFICSGGVRDAMLFPCE